MTSALRLRHRLVPYLHTMNHRAAHDGTWTIVLHAPGHITVRRRQPDDPLYEIRLAEQGDRIVLKVVRLLNSDAAVNASGYLL